MSKEAQSKRRNEEGLNPYYNGRYSMSYQKTLKTEIHGIVLILIIMEDTL